MAGQKFTLTFDAQLNIGQMKGAIGNIQSELNRLQLPQNLTKGISGTLSSLEKEIRNFEVASRKDLGNKNNFSALERSAEKIQSLFTDLQIQARDLGSSTDLSKFFPQSIVDNIQKGKQALEEYNNTLKKLEQNQARAQKNLTNAQNRQTVAKGNLDANRAELEKFQQQYESTLNQIYTKVKMSPENIFDTKSIEEAMQKVEQLFAKYQNIQNGVNSKGKPYADSTKLTAARQQADLEALISTYRQLAAVIPGVEKAQKQLETAYTNATNKVKEMQLALDQAKTASEGGQAEAIKKVFEQLNAAGIDTSSFEQNLAGAQAALKAYAQTAEGDAAAALQKLNEAIRNNGAALAKNKADMQSASDSFRQFNDQVREVGVVKSRIQYFFGLSNAINLVKRAIRGAFSTIKELDAAMTETAVVTNYTVKDMWDQLPEYTKRANELGVTTKDAYESATLYFQQGLNNEQAAALSVETLKMARIAGLDAAEATDRMTNALRGFNMELDTASAQRVDDVYSQLAAMSASNVDEISTAMTKVASLAHSANMEFETTAAFLAQIIETTRESAETAGTALKTVVARFSEVKKLVDTNTLKGTDEEGQVVDVNKVSQALRTAGIDLNKYFLGEVGLDDIFMELASKWDSLTNVQQRYIATQAAGSRQQSRFIALMQDYARTQELVGAAYNAEGASARQFEKTQDSLQSKLARLKNAWNEFLMGLTNNQMVKTAVDLLTNLLNFLNKLTSGFDSTTSSVLKFVAALGGFVGLKSLFSSGGLVDRGLMTLLAGTGFGNAAVKGGLLSGLVLGGRGRIAEGLTGEAATNAAAAAAGATATHTPLLLGVGNGLKSFGGKAWNTAGALGSIYGLEGTAAGLAGIGTALGAVAVAVGAVYAGYQAWLNLSPKGQLKNAQNYAKAMDQAAQSTKQTATQSANALVRIKELNQAEQTAISSAQRQEVIEDRNNYIASLIESNKQYAQYVRTTFENGQLKLTIDEASFANAVDAAQKAAARTAAGASFANAIVASKQANLIQGRMARFAGGQITTGTNSETGETYTRNLTPAEQAQYIKYQQELSQATSEFQSYAANAFAQLIDPDQFSDETANLMSRALAEGFDETTLPTGSGWWRSRGHWQNEYFKAYGVEADSNMRTSDIYRAVRQSEITGNQEESVEALTQLLTGSNAKNGNALLEAFLGEGILNTKNLLAQNIGNEDALFALFGLDTGSQAVGQALVDLADALGKTTDEVRDQIKERAKQRKKEQGQVQYATSARMLQGGISANNVARYLSLTELADQQIFESLYESIDSSFISEDLVSQLFEGIKEEGFADWFKSIDLSNPIQAFSTLTQAANNGKGAIQDVAQELLKVGQENSQFSASNQLTYLTLSEGYESLSESLGKFIDENGSISSANILELAESNSDLNAMLENNVMSAHALAVALQGIETTDLNVWELSDSIIAALNAMDDLDGEVASIIDELNSFDPGYDENDVTSFINKVFENATENIEKGAVGNNQLRNYMDYIFGDFDKEFADGKWGTDYGTGYQSWLNNNVQWLEANKDNMFSAWSNFSKELDNHMLGAAEIYEKDGEIIINANKMTTDQLIQAMVETGNVTETQARMMIADFKNYSADFAHEMAENDLPNAIQAWVDNVKSKQGGLYDDSELDTLANILGVKRERLEEEISKLQADADELKGIKFTEPEGPRKGERTSTSIENAWNEIGGLKSQTAEIVRGAVIEGPELFDYDSIKQAYNNLGIPQMFEQDFNQVLQEGDSFYARLFGSDVPTQISIDKGQTAGEAYAEAYQEAVNTNLADQLANSIKEVFGEEIELKINTEDGVSRLELVQKAAEDVTEAAIEANGQTVAPTGDSSGLNGVSSSLDTIIGQINSINNMTVSPKSSGVSVGGTFLGANRAAGGIVQSHAAGSANNKVSPGVSLTGEEGPEIVWNKDKGYAYITGEQHPEFQNLQPGDRVFNAQETKKILGGAAAGGVVPSFARGYGGSSSSKKSSGGGGGGGGSGSGSDKTSDEWKNDLDWLYNLMEDIAELERDQKAIEEDYEDALKDQTKTGKDLYNLLIKQLGNLYTQLDHQTFALQKREQEMREFMDTTNDQDQYLWYNWQDRTLEIDWDAIDQITDENLYKHVKELIDEAEDIQGKMDDAEDAIMDITNQIQELENIWRETFTDFEDRVYDAIVKQYQTVIDNYSELNDTLNNSNSQILDSLQKQISLERQIRDNTKTEEEIANDEARLAYLRRDTSGGNDLAALQLESELAEQRQNYEDTLVDQAISRLQEDNDAAAQQRQQQIDIMQAQLDYQSQNGEFNAAVRELLESAMGADGELLTNSDLANLLKEQENWEAMSDVSKTVWEEELNGTFKEVAAFLLKQNAEENGTFYTALTSAVNSVSSAIGSYSQAITKLGNAASSGGSSGGGGGGGSGSGGGGNNGGGTPPPKTPSGQTASLYGLNNASARYATAYVPTSVPGAISGILKYKKYATGGLADATGLAWLDGTPGEPEYVLNARQTDAFLKLADVLPSMMGADNTGGQTNTFGSNYINLSVNLDSVSPDYDVDRMVDLLKDKLYDSGSYRNINSLSFLR